jgi:hypothetical protein
MIFKLSFDVDILAFSGLATVFATFKKWHFLSHGYLLDNFSTFRIRIYPKIQLDFIRYSRKNHTPTHSYQKVHFVGF